MLNNMNSMESYGPPEPQPVEESSTPFPPTPEETGAQMRNLNELRYQFDRSLPEDRERKFQDLMDALDAATAVDPETVTRLRNDARLAKEILNKN